MHLLDELINLIKNKENSSINHNLNTFKTPNKLIRTGLRTLNVNTNVQTLNLSLKHTTNNKQIKSNRALDQNHYWRPWEDLT